MSGLPIVETKRKEKVVKHFKNQKYNILNNKEFFYCHKKSKVERDDIIEF